MEDSHQSEHIPQWKKDEIEEIKELIKKYPLFGVVGVAGIPAKQLQKMRRDLKDTAVLKVARNTLIKRAFDESSEDVRKMEEYIDVQTALIFTEQNPFKLYKSLEKSKTPSPIKGGTVAPKDIVVHAGPTGFPPGPILGEMQSVGIPASIDSGKVMVKETKTVAKEGTVVPQKLAAMLTRLEVYPMIVGLDLRAVLEEGFVFTPDVLAIDDAKFLADLTLAASQALNLSVYAAYPTADSIRTIIAKATSESRNLGVYAAIPAPELMDALLGKAFSQMLAVASAASDVNGEAIDDELKETLGARTAAVVTTAVATEAVEQKEEEEDNSEEDGMAGLGALFG